MLKVSLKDIMSEDLIKLKENATVGQAAHILLRFRINGLLVVKANDGNSLTGIITTTDLLRFLDKAMSKHGHRKEALDSIATLPLAKVVRRNVTKIQADAKIEKVIALMHRQNVHTLPVYGGKKLIGVIGRHDILNIVFSG
ncbi:MAG: CBS domain-containing protein [Candidatus Omnitrophica bacterium]|nr:CBS domain-containing protein [Candidatus Omnitrophota bacterium]